MTISEAYSELKRIKAKKLKRGLDTYDDEPPSEVAYSLIAEVVNNLHAYDLKPDSIIPSVMGGLGIVFRHGGYYADIEAYNDGDLAACLYKYNSKEQTIVWELDTNDLKTSINFILKILQDTFKNNEKNSTEK